MKDSLYGLVAQLNTSPLPKVTPDNTRLQSLAQMAFGIIAAVAVLMIVIAGFRYIIASGDAAKMAQAKRAIIYTSVGLLITLSAFVIVTFVARGVSR